MPLTTPPPIDYTTKEFHYSFKIGDGYSKFCSCDRCQGIFSHGYNECIVLTWKDKKWLCINCRETKS